MGGGAVPSCRGSIPADLSFGSPSCANCRHTSPPSFLLYISALCSDAMEYWTEHIPTCNFHQILLPHMNQYLGEIAEQLNLYNISRIFKGDRIFRPLVKMYLSSHFKFFQHKHTVTTQNYLLTRQFECLYITARGIKIIVSLHALCLWPISAIFVT